MPWTYLLTMLLLLLLLVVLLSLLLWIGQAERLDAQGISIQLLILLSSQHGRMTLIKCIEAVLLTEVRRRRY